MANPSGSSTESARDSPLCPRLFRASPLQPLSSPTNYPIHLKDKTSISNTSSEFGWIPLFVVSVSMVTSLVSVSLNWRWGGLTSAQTYLTRPGSPRDRTRSPGCSVSWRPRRGTSLSRSRPTLFSLWGIKQKSDRIRGPAPFSRRWIRCTRLHVALSRVSSPFIT